MRTITFSLNGGGATVINLDDAANGVQTRDAIQSALDQVSANALGGAVILSAGTFVVAPLSDAGDGVLRVGSNTNFSGAGIGLSVIRLADNPGHDVTGIVRTDSGKTNPDGSLQSTHDVSIHDLSIDGNMAHSDGFAVDGFFCGPKPFTVSAIDDNIHLSNVEVYAASRYGFDPHEHTTNLTLTSCISHNNGQDGFTIDDCTGVIVTNCEAYANGRHGFNVVTSSHDMLLTGNLSHDNQGSGIVVQTGIFEMRALTSHVEILGGTVSNNGGDGIVVRQASGVTIGGSNPGDGVSISGNGRFGILIEGGDTVLIDGNTVSGNVGGIGTDNAEIRIRGYAQTYLDADALNDVFVPSSAVTVTNNTIGSNNLPHSYAVSYSDAGTPIIGLSNTLFAIPTLAVEDTSKQGLTPLFVAQITTGDDVISGSAGRDTITGDSGNDHVSGGAGDDILYGADGNDWLDGGDGSDVLRGGLGDDIYVAGAGDTVIENANEGTDEIMTGLASFSLADFATIENLSYEGTGNFSGTGNSGANAIIGGTGNDILDGGIGADVLNGGFGNDTYVIDNAGDVVIDAGGLDTIMTIFQTVLADKFENLVLQGNSNINGTGNALNNVLVGNSGHNLLTGFAGNDSIFGGKGNDTLSGGGGRDILSGGDGADQFLFDTRGSSNIDRITDFSAPWDTIVLENAVFTKLKGLGTLSAGQFYKGAGAHDANDRIIYNAKTGTLIYDSNGNGAGGATVFAILEKGLPITHFDIFVV